MEVVCRICDRKVKKRDRLKHLRVHGHDPKGRWPKETLDSIFVVSKRLNSWKQDTPRQQFSALLGTLLGEVSNIQDGIEPARALQRIKRWSKEIKQLGDAYLQEKWW